RQHAIPVCYAPEFGPDLPALAAHAGLSIEEVIARHTAPVYTVHFLGFMPGFPYLGGLDARLSMPRLSTPRLLVPEGSVGIGGEQTGIYP
ncbi:5-oxoprolinase subunit B family protein, partial [Vibrio parahaemolyticus]